MSSSPKLQEPGLINSSYVVFFHVLILVIAPFLVNAFPPELRGDVLIVAVVLPIILFWFSYFIKQIVEATTILKVLAGAFFVIAALSFINAVYGPLSSDSVPVVYTQVPFFATLLAGLSGQPGLIYAGTIMTYGAYTYISAVALASLFESLYGTLGSRFMPSSMKSKLAAADARIDRTALNSSDKAFIHSQKLGVGICLTLIAAYATLYVLLIILT